MANELTYILGAGASYNSFPVVKTFVDRISYFSSVIEKQTSIHNSGFINEINKFVLEVKSHQSFDTYFKKLFHLGKDQSILTAKKILNFYFLWEQIEFPENSPYHIRITDRSGNDLTYPITEYSFVKKDLVDSRYDALIAGLLKPVKSRTEFFTKINFITWNYDLNLLLSVKNFLAPDKNLNEFIAESSSSENSNIWKISEDLQIINMNGYFYSTFFNDIRNFNVDEIFEVRNEIAEKKDTFNFRRDIIDSDARKIHFGWEDIDTKSNLTDTATKAIRNSKSVIVIGYTFPSYNRYVDAKYFTGSTLSGKDVFIQDPRADEIVDFLNSEFDIDEPFKTKYISERLRPKFYSKKNCDSFFIPNNIISKI